MNISQKQQYQIWESNEEIQAFREYLRIPSVHPDVDYDECVHFLRRQATSLDLEAEVVEVNPAKPVVIISWVGTDPSAPSIILNSHMDVVPVYAEMWSHPPFAAHMDEEGRIYGRGSQDMKCVGIQFLAVIRTLKREGVKLRRTLHVTFVPDEETGGELGMRDFVRTERFKKLNCGFAIDEGYATEEEVFRLFYGERAIRRANFYISGTPGHGSLLLSGTAGEKARKLLDRMMDYRAMEEKKLENNPELSIGDVTMLNLTMCAGGVQCNVVPPEIMLCFDIRVSNDISIKQFDALLEKWCNESGGGIRIEFAVQNPVTEVTRLDDSNQFWVALKGALDKMNLEVRPRINPGATDIRFLRELGIPAVGFSPMNRTPVLLHDHDEYLHAETFLKGIDIYKEIVVAIANV
ncbi:aminoacylase-1B-like [Topomyia yanbarensis]|uniref:aminoacylase-1B-like n=1 Tax=Topomyia yanbarensis TaxID=2498891 RepID=UPI00273C3392|nr:aminoacylase-1B-like [Topomyia yanbarensis]